MGFTGAIKGEEVAMTQHFLKQISQSVRSVSPGEQAEVGGTHCHPTPKGLSLCTLQTIHA